MRRCGSLILASGDRNRVPAGGALAVDREGFSAAVTRALEDEPLVAIERGEVAGLPPPDWDRSEEHTSELQSLMRISYAVFCLKKKKINKNMMNRQIQKDKYNYNQI